MSLVNPGALWYSHLMRHVILADCSMQAPNNFQGKGCMSDRGKLSYAEIGTLQFQSSYHSLSSIASSDSSPCETLRSDKAAVLAANW